MCSYIEIAGYLMQNNLAIHILCDLLIFDFFETLWSLPWVDCNIGFLHPVT